MNPESGPVFCQLNLLTRDMAAAMAFYRLLGLQVSESPGGAHADVLLPGGVSVEWETIESAAVWDSGSRPGIGGSVIVGFGVATRPAVDHLYAKLTAAGYRGHQRPYVAFWGARYAIVDDPDGNAVGLTSPVEDEHRYWPPRQAPSA